MVRSTGTVNSKGLQSTCVNDMRASMPMLCFGAGNGMGAVASDVKLASSRLPLYSQSLAPAYLMDCLLVDGCYHARYHHVHQRGG